MDFKNGTKTADCADNERLAAVLSSACLPRGSPVPVTSSTVESNIALVGSPRWAHFLPDGQHFTFNNEPGGACNDRTEIRFAAVDGKEDHPLLRIGLACTDARRSHARLKLKRRELAPPYMRCPQVDQDFLSNASEWLLARF